MIGRSVQKALDRKRIGDRVVGVDRVVAQRLWDCALQMCVAAIAVHRVWVFGVRFAVVVHLTVDSFDRSVQEQVILLQRYKTQIQFHIVMSKP